MNSPGTDREILIHKAYANEEALATRQRIHQLYSVPNTDYSTWVLSRLKWRGDEQVLDIGAGQGMYAKAVKARAPRGKYYAGDLSMGMLKAASQSPLVDATLNLDAQQIPFPDHSLDVVMANHMLYHVPDIEAALKEFRRILKPSGVLITATHSQFNQPEFDQIMRRVFTLLGANNADIEVALKPVSEPYQLESGTLLLARHFSAIVRYDLPGAFMFPTKEPVVEYFSTLRAFLEPRLPGKVTWAEFITVISEQVGRLVNHFGELVVNKLSGVLIATESGSFIEEFHRIQDTLRTR